MYSTPPSDGPARRTMCMYMSKDINSTQPDPCTLYCRYSVHYLGTLVSSDSCVVADAGAFTGAAVFSPSSLKAPSVPLRYSDVGGLAPTDSGVPVVP